MTTRKTVVLVALGLGLVCAMAAGPAVFVLIGQRYTAYSVLHIAMQSENILDRSTPLVDRDRFDMFKNSQQEQLLSRMVLLSALRKPEVKDIPIVREKMLFSDPIDWLAGKLSVSFPGNAEVMVVSLSLEDPKEAKTLVNAVVDSYMAEVVNAENDKKKKKYDEAERICGEKEQQIRMKREELKSLVGGATGADPESLGVKLKMVLEELALYRNQAAQASYETGKVKSELAGKRALLEEIETTPADPGELETLVNSDPRARELSAKLANEQADQPHDKTVVKSVATIPGEQTKTLQAQYDARVRELSQKVREKQHAVVMRKVIELEPQLRSLEKSEVALAGKIAKIEEEARILGQTPVDIQMIQMQLRNLDQVLTAFVIEKERLGVEIKSAPRICVQEIAEEPPVPSNTLMRIVLTGVAMLVTFCCVAAVVILLYALTRRKQTADG
jgi:uncharacterized protein involved in exopolysaccharide biosynthesis